MLRRAAAFGDLARRTMHHVRGLYAYEKKHGPAEPPKKKGLSATTGKPTKEKMANLTRRQLPDVTPRDAAFQLKGVSINYIMDRPFQAAGTVPAVREEELHLMRFIGSALTTSDVFTSTYLASPPPPVVDVPGRMLEHFPDEGERAALMKKFSAGLSGRPKVGEEVLSLLKKKGDALCKTLLDLRGREKMLSTYYDDTKGGMLSLVHKYDSCIHHQLLHNKTATGRLASANPNCQNIPKENKGELRDLFISRFTDKARGVTGVCIEADYSQLEVVTLCSMAHDVNMTADLKAKVDFHCKRVTLMHPQYSYEEVVQRAKKDKEKEFVDMRQAAKIFSFQRQYGAGVAMLSASTKLEPDVIRQLIENEKKNYYGIDRFYDMVTHSCHAFDPTIQDGKRNTEGDVLFKGAFPVLSGSVYVFSESNLPDAILQSRQQGSSKFAGKQKSTAFSPTHLKNYPVQGFAGEIVQVMLGCVYRMFAENNNYGGKALLTNTVHDCIWVDCLPEVAPQVSRDLDRVMSSARTELNRLWPEMQVETEFPVEVVAGDNMGDMTVTSKLGW
jgi:hypothetical protein